MAGIFNSAIFNNAIFNTGAVAVADTATPGFRHLYPLGQSKVEDEAEKLARRIREGTIPAPVVPIVPVVDEKYRAESARLARGIEKAREQARTYRVEVERLEQAQVKRQTAKLQRELLHAQQALQLAMVQEAVFLEEMEVVDVAFVASAVLNVVLQ